MFCFALLDRIVAERGHAVLGQQNTHALVGLTGLAVATVPTGNENARVRRVLIGQTKIGRNEVFRLTLEDDVFHTVAAAERGEELEGGSRVRSGKREAPPGKPGASNERKRKTSLRRTETYSPSPREVSFSLDAAGRGLRRRCDSFAGQPRRGSGLECVAAPPPVDSRRAGPTGES